MELKDLSLLSTSVQNRYRENFKSEDCTLPSSFKSYFQKFNYNDIIEYFEYSLVVHASSSLDIYIPNQWIYIAYYFVEYYNMLKAYRDKVLSLLSKEDIKSCANNEELTRHLLNHYDGNDKEYLIKFLSDYTWWRGGKTIDRNDYYVSPILSIAGLVNASQSYVTDICKNLAESETAFQVLDDFIKDGEIENVNTGFVNPFLQQIYYGAPGTGKSYLIDQMTTEDNSVRTTFHPDSDYASFVGAYKPTMEDVPISAIVGKEVHAAVPQGDHTGKEKKIVYKYVPQAFLKAYVKAWGNLDNPCYLIIEEINRGNCAQIFGDLFQLLDRNNMGSSSYPIQADEDIARFLKEDENGFAGFTSVQRKTVSDFILVKDNGDKRYIGDDILNGRLLLFPPNLHLWATMNTSDQSLFPIDSAFKRRWDWSYVPISYKPKDKKTQKGINWKLKIDNKFYSWGDFLAKINPVIYTLTESSDKQMGYFFAKANPETGVISQDVFLNKVIFYLWTEVFKDFDMSNDIFKNKKENRSFRFTDFFEDNEAINNFIENLNLTELDDIDSLEDNEKNSNKKYNLIVEGQNVSSITEAFYSILDKISKETSYTEIDKKVKENIKREEPVIKEIENRDEYKKENGWLNKIIITTDNVPFVVTNQWKKEMIPMIENLAISSGINFEYQILTPETEKDELENSELQNWRFNFWEEVKQNYSNKGIEFKATPTGNYLQTTMGITNLNIINSINRQNGSCWVGIYIEKASAEDLYPKLLNFKEQIDSSLPFKVQWIPNDEKHGYASIRISKSGMDLLNREDRSSAIEWLVSHGNQIYKVFKPIVDALK